MFYIYWAVVRVGRIQLYQIVSNVGRMCALILSSLKPSEANQIVISLFC